MSLQNEDSKKSSKTPANRDGKPLLCPKCKEHLLIGYDHDVEVDYCNSCKGIWVDPIEEKDLLKMKPEVFTIDELKRLRKLYQPPVEMEKAKSYVACPICQALMWRRNWGSYSGVIVDRCEKHGTWYDDKELAKVQEFVALGGVEYEKYKLAEVAITDLDMKLMRTAARLDKDIQDAYRRARWYSILGF